MGQPVLPRRPSEEKSEKIPKDSTTVTCPGEKASKPSNEINRKRYILLYFYFISYAIISILRAIKNF